MRLIIFLFFLFFYFIVFSQQTSELQFKSGILLIDKVGPSSSQGLGLNGKASMSEILYLMRIAEVKKFNIKVGAGLSAINYYYFETFNNSPRSWAYYLPFKVGAEIPLYKQKLMSSIMLSNYLSLNPQSTRYEYSTVQRPWPLLTERRVFTNVDLGLSAQISKRISLTISTPINILPIVASAKGVTHTDLSNTPGSNTYRVRAEMWGATLGIKWTLGKVEDRPGRNKKKVRIDRY